MKGWITSVCTTYALPPSLQDALHSKKKFLSWTKGFGDKGERRKKGFIRAALGNTGGEFWIAQASQISWDNKQQGRAAIIHLLSYFCKQSICHNSTLERIISCTPPSHNPFLPLVGDAVSIHLACFSFLFFPSSSVLPSCPGLLLSLIMFLFSIQPNCCQHRKVTCSYLA